MTLVILHVHVLEDFNQFPMHKLAKMDKAFLLVFKPRYMYTRTGYCYGISNPFH